MPSRTSSATARLQLESQDARWRCPVRWIRQAPDTHKELPPLLWAQEHVQEALRLTATLHRPGLPQHLQIVSPPGWEWASAIAEHLATQAGDTTSVVLLQRPQQRLLRGEGGPGELHRCDESIVVVEVARLLDDDDAWPALREAMTLGSVSQLPGEQQGSPNQVARIDSARLSAVLVGPESDFRRLREQDGALTTLVPSRVIIRTEVSRDSAGVGTLVGLLRTAAETAGVGAVSAPALAWLIEEEAGRTTRRGHISIQVAESIQCLREARLLQPKGTLNEASVREAMAHMRARRATAEENHRVRVEFGQLLLHAKGKKQGVVNGLMVYGAGPASYCIPGRITARVSVGREGLVNIEREAKYSGRSFDKGVFLLNGFLRGLFAQESPLGLGATLAFEQSYGKVDGDSATLAEAVALISELSGLPCRQDIGVTGAINQRGELLPVGSINLKVLGWWKTCQQLGRTGTQGVLLPRATVPALQIPRELQAAMERGEFHLWAADTIEEALELLLETPAGLAGAHDGRFEDSSVYAKVAKRLGTMSQRLYPKRREPTKRKGPPAKIAVAETAPTGTKSPASTKGGPPRPKALAKKSAAKKKATARKKKGGSKKLSDSPTDRAAATPSSESSQ